MAVRVALLTEGVDDDGDATALLVGHFFDRKEGGSSVDVALVVVSQVTHCCPPVQGSFQLD